MVLVSSCNNFNRVCRPFLWGKKPSKTNLSQGNPEFTKAGTKAVAPGKHSTSISFSTQALTNKNPGSEIAGVPASLIKAMVIPNLIYLLLYLNFCARYVDEKQSVAD